MQFSLLGNQILCNILDCFYFLKVRWLDVMRNGWRGLFAWHTCQKTANLGGREFIIAASDEYATWKPDWFSNLDSQQVFLFESGDETLLASFGIQGAVIFLQFFAFVLTSAALTSWSVASWPHICSGCKRLLSHLECRVHISRKPWPQSVLAQRW